MVLSIHARDPVGDPTGTGLKTIGDCVDATGAGVGDGDA